MQHHGFHLLVLGFIFGLASILLCFMGDPCLPIPLAIVSASFCISGAILNKKS